MTTVFVAPSTLPGAGRGLFVRSDVARGDRLTEYDGELIDHTEAMRRRNAVPRRDSHIRNLGGGVYADAASIDPQRPAGAGLGGFANDGTPSGRQNNAEMIQVWDSRCARYRVLVIAISNIKAGQEVLLSYGRDYWGACHKQK